MTEQVTRCPDCGLVYANEDEICRYCDEADDCQVCGRADCNRHKEEEQRP